MQLLLGAPFAPASSGAEVLLDVVDELRAAVANAAGGAQVASAASGRSQEPTLSVVLCAGAGALLLLYALGAWLTIHEGGTPRDVAMAGGMGVLAAGSAVATQHVPSLAPTPHPRVLLARGRCHT